jgi:hypothetical protein
MPAKRNWVGLVFERLTVIEEVPPTKARVRCECGKVKVVWRCSLSTGATTSCGCWQKEVVRVMRSTTLQEKLLDRIDMRGEDECWPWLGGTDGKGYGLINSAPNGETRAHRAAWVHFNGPIPEGKNVLHTCDNPPCCNPKHLFLGGQQENIDDMIAKGRAWWQAVKE